MFTCACRWLWASTSSSSKGSDDHVVRLQTSPTSVPTMENVVHATTACKLGDVSSTPSFIEIIIDDCIGLFRSFTRSDIGDDAWNSFWMDLWLPGGQLFLRFPTLFSHITRPNTMVPCIVRFGFHLQPRLSAVRGWATCGGSVCWGT